LSSRRRILFATMVPAVPAPKINKLFIKFAPLENN
jgi:hypothetical protein